MTSSDSENGITNLTIELHEKLASFNEKFDPKKYLDFGVLRKTPSFIEEMLRISNSLDTLYIYSQEEGSLEISLSVAPGIVKELRVFSETLSLTFPGTTEDERPMIQARDIEGYEI